MIKPTEFDNWEIKDAASTLARAEEIKSNSKLHNAAIKHTQDFAKKVTASKRPRSFAGKRGK